MTQKFRRHSPTEAQGRSWRDYQETLDLSQPRRAQRFTKALVVFGGLPVLIVVSIYLLLRMPGGITRQTDLRPTPSAQAPQEIRNQSDLRQVLDPETLFNPPSASLEIEVNNRLLTVETSLDLNLQEYLLGKMDRKNSRYIGIVAMETDTGRVLVMTGFNKIDPAVNPCIESSYPAASIFKIITASAAVEAAGLSPDARLLYNGQKHTLYKSQLKKHNNHYSNKTTLRDSFAQSINPVFGKIGTHRLGKDELEKYAEALGFNREIPFDLHLNPSVLHLSEEPYQLAEIASGFNRETTLSPLHGAVIVATLLNGGRWVSPTVIEKITDKKGTPVYRRETPVRDQALAPETSQALREMMAATITSGTGRKAFRGHRKDKILSRLTMGGKTGSIFNKAHDARFDWFVGYAEDEKENKSITVSVVVAHEEFIGIRAAQYARMVMRKYFADYYAKTEKSSTL